MTASCLHYWSTGLTERERERQRDRERDREREREGETDRQTDRQTDQCSTMQVRRCMPINVQRVKSAMIALTDGTAFRRFYHKMSG